MIALVVARDFALVRRLGVPVWRGSFGWDDYEPEPGVYDFAWLERFTSLAADSGIALRPLRASCVQFGNAEAFDVAAFRAYPETWTPDSVDVEDYLGEPYHDAPGVEHIGIYELNDLPRDREVIGNELYGPREEKRRWTSGSAPPPGPPVRPAWTAPGRLSARWTAARFAACGSAREPRPCCGSTRPIEPMPGPETPVLERLMHVVSSLHEGAKPTQEES